MNDEKIEELLRKAPAVKAPAGLLQELQRAVKLPRAETGGRREFGSRSGLKRWMPALSFAAFILGCFVVIGVQTSLLTDLKRENETLRTATPNLEQLRADNADYKKLLAQSQELERLRQDNADLARLRGEVAQLQAQAQQIEQLRAENQKLQQSNASRLAQNAGSIGSLDGALEKAKQRAEAVACLNNLKQIGLAIRVWAQDNNEVRPDNFICMTNELNNWRILQCPSDKSRNVTNWADVAAGNVSYQILSSGRITNAPSANVVLVQCPIHGSAVFDDGHGQIPGTNAPFKLKRVDGITVLDK